jgi:hypothetical protein
MKLLAAASCAAIIALSPAITSAQKKPQKSVRPKVEHLACTLGTEDRHARIAIELVDGKVNRFAYYSKWKPRTCSMEVERDDAYSKWADTGDVTVVTLVEEMGAFLIDHERSKFRFIFRDIDRMRYCGMEGKINGSLTLWRGRRECDLQGVMDEEESSTQTAEGGGQKAEGGGQKAEKE